MHPGLRLAECAAAGCNERRPAEVESRERLAASLLAAPVGAGLPVGAIHRASRRLLVCPNDDLRAAREATGECRGRVGPR